MRRCRYTSRYMSCSSKLELDQLNEREPWASDWLAGNGMHVCRGSRHASGRHSHWSHAQPDTRPNRISHMSCGAPEFPPRTGCAGAQAGPAPPCCALAVLAPGTARLFWRHKHNPGRLPSGAVEARQAGLGCGAPECPRQPGCAGVYAGPALSCCVLALRQSSRAP